MALSLELTAGSFLRDFLYTLIFVFLFPVTLTCSGSSALHGVNPN